MTATALTFTSTATPATAITQTVSVRQFWSGEWTVTPYLHCTSVSWTAAPQIGVARLRWRYGVGMREGETTYARVQPASLQNYYVKVTLTVEDYDTPGGTAAYDWYGIIRSVTDEIHGMQVVVVPTVTGVQTLTAYGLESLLDRDVILTGRASYSEGGVLETQTFQRGLTFNEKGVPNKDPLQFVFWSGTGDGELWTTRSIVKHLFEEHGPRDNNGNKSVPFAISETMLDRLPSWDRPVVPTHGVTLWKLLNALMARQRAIGWTYRVDDNDIVQIEPFSWVTDDLTLDDDGNIFKANQSQFDINCIADARFSCRVRTDTSGTVDQVIVQGRRRRSVFSVSDTDSNLEAGWPSALETEYEAGASGDAGYPAAAEKDLRRKRNDEARRADRLRDVYSRYKLLDDWDLKAADGIGGSQTYVTPSDDDPTQVSRLYRAGIKIQSTMPLLAGYDYSGTNIADDAVTQFGQSLGEQSAILGVTPLPDESTRFVQIEHVGDIGQREQRDDEDDSIRKWRGMARATGQEAAFRVYVHGMPQHTIAYTDFSGQSEDESTGQWDWQDMIFTVAIDDDRHAQAKYPADDDLIAFQDVRRILHVSAGSEYTQDFVVAGTVVSVDPEDGTLQRSTTGGFINDTTAELARLSRLAYIWYGSDRTLLEIDTSRMTDALKVGDMIRKFHTTGVDGDAYSIDGPITQIMVQWPIGGEETPPLPRMAYQTGYANLDPLKL